MNDTFCYNCYVECPNCGSARTDVDEFDAWFDQSKAIIPMYCHSCGTTWDSVYKFECHQEIDVLKLDKSKGEE